MIIKSRAPVRIDLAGGTVDIWPLYLFLSQFSAAPMTINFAIDLWAETEIQCEPSFLEAASQSLFFQSQDQKAEVVFSWKDFLNISFDFEALQQKVPAVSQLELPLRLFLFFAQREWRSDPSFSFKQNRVVVTTRAQSPAGAGLGGSSALAISLAGAYNQLFYGPSRSLSQQADAFTSEELIQIVRDLETRVIRVPAGLQDYYSAMYGGLQSLHWGIPHVVREALPKMEGFFSRVLLFYSGKSRNSGLNNWVLYQAFLNQDLFVQSHFQKIGTATHRLYQAFLNQNEEEAVSAIDQEWQVRKSLAPGITTAEIEGAFEKLRQERSGKWVYKICGAGGGGCFFVILPKGEDRGAVETFFEREGMKALPFRMSTKGLEFIEV